MKMRLRLDLMVTLLWSGILLTPIYTRANPYLVKPSETPVAVYVATCATA
jgi:hypothetical protein